MNVNQALDRLKGGDAGDRAIAAAVEAEIERLNNFVNGMKGIANTQGEIIAEQNEEIERLKSENALLRTGDTCARHCEGVAFRHEAQRLTKDNERLKEDAERYRFLRDEDNWGCDNDETTESRWGDLGECHGGDFDAFVDKARAALAGKGTTHG